MQRTWTIIQLQGSTWRLVRRRDHILNILKSRHFWWIWRRKGVPTLQVITHTLYSYILYIYYIYIYIRIHNIWIMRMNSIPCLSLCSHVSREPHILSRRRPHGESDAMACALAQREPRPVQVVFADDLVAGAGPRCSDTTFETGCHWMIGISILINSG